MVRRLSPPGLAVTRPELLNLPAVRSIRATADGRIQPGPGQIDVIHPVGDHY